ncbi:MAG: PAS domain S-box protein [Betaproteobacteria bacterium]|nr:PAS domain S-box protein [Betaproteobacteria bacterium]
MLREEIRVLRGTAEVADHPIAEQLEIMTAVFDSSTAGIAFIKDRIMVRANNKLEELFGYDSGELHGQPTRCWYPDEESYRTVGEAYSNLAKGNIYRQEMQMQRKDGSRFWSRLSGRALYDDLSRGSVWMVEDITFEHEAAEEILQTKEEMAAIFETSTFGVALVKDRVMIRANKKLEELFGYGPGELHGQPTRCWYPDEASYRIAGEAYYELARGNTAHLTMQMRHKDGSLFWSRLSGRTISSNLLHGSVWTVEDFTVEHEATEAVLKAKDAAEDAERKLRDSYMELEKTNQRLQKLDQMKSDFLSSVSHELRTPLTSIRGFSQLIEREFVRSFAPLTNGDAGLEKKVLRVQENLKIILKESERLTRLINDVLDLAKIEAGRTEWRDAPIQVADFMRDAVNATYGMFEQKPEITLQLDIQPDLPIIIGDADHLLQVLVNLINNAVKFTDSGSIMIHAFLNSDSLIQIEIRDTGIGFPPEDAEAIFDKFQQSMHGDTLQDRPKGTGLGLAICREIINRHGGRVWAQSQPNHGSTFTLTLPAATKPPTSPVSVGGIAPVSDDDRTIVSDRSQGKPKVLVVDDDPGIRDYFAQLLQEQGFEVATAMDGQMALSAARGFAPDLITMDLAMPVMDGRTAIALFRADPELHNIPIMVISAIPDWEAAGGDAAMGKPPNEELFIKNIRSLLNQPTTNNTETTETVHFLMLYDGEHAPTTVPKAYAAWCEVDFCTVRELPTRLCAGFKGMVAIPVDLLSQVDISLLNADPSLKVMVLPVVAVES